MTNSIKSIPRQFYIFGIFMLSLFMITCKSGNKFGANDCIVSSSGENNILKILGSNDEQYITNSFLIFEGKRLLVEDLMKHPRQKLELDFIKTSCPKIDDSISIDLLMNEHNIGD